MACYVVRKPLRSAPRRAMAWYRLGGRWFRYLVAMILTGAALLDFVLAVIVTGVLG